MKDKSTKNLRKSMGRGSVEHETHVYEREGEVMTLANKNVVTISPTTTIKEAAKTMVREKFRRLPVTDPGSGKLLGILTAMDILSFLGGGDKFNLMEIKHHDNFLSAINESVKKIMSLDVKYINHKDTINHTIDLMIDESIGAVPIVDDNNKVVGIVSERDFILSMAGVFTDELVQELMTSNLIITTPGTPVESATKIMVRNQFRRIPIVGKEFDGPGVEDEHLVGLITSTDILKFFGDSGLLKKLGTNSGIDVLNTKVSDFMVNDVITVEPLTRVGDLCELLANHNIGGVPVVKNQELLGIITERDILKFINQ
ncbi:MAG: CBS domain-containing protein [Methanobrevibacter sp.]|jgi:CBS domain-containing protein|nr:CBS domain-containing protein [Methanobrevibacter sp.]